MNKIKADLLFSIENFEASKRNSPPDLCIGSDETRYSRGDVCLHEKFFNLLSPFLNKDKSTPLLEVTISALKGPSKTSYLILYEESCWVEIWALSESAVLSFYENESSSGAAFTEIFDRYDGDNIFSGCVREVATAFPGIINFCLGLKRAKFNSRRGNSFYTSYISLKFKEK